MLDRIRWLGQSSFLLQGPPLIYIDPYGISRSAFLADVILVSRASYEYCSPADIRKLLGPGTQVIGDEAVDALLDDISVNVVRPWQSVTMDRVRITAVPHGQTDNDQAATPSGTGFLISLDYYDVYYAGDTAQVPETIPLRPDVAIIPIRNAASGLMSIEQAVRAVEILKPRWVVPSQWSTASGGGYLDLRAFQAAVGDLADVVVPEQL